LNVRQFGMVEGTELKCTVSRSRSMTCMTSILNFIKIYQFFQKLLVGGTHRQTDRWSRKPHFPF
jgi:hypothetical protein